MMLGQRGRADQKLNWLPGWGFGEGKCAVQKMHARRQSQEDDEFCLRLVLIVSEDPGTYCGYCMVFDEFSIPSGENCANHMKGVIYVYKQRQTMLFPVEPTAMLRLKSRLDTKHGPITVCISDINYIWTISQLHMEWFIWHFLSIKFYVMLSFFSHTDTLRHWVLWDVCLMLVTTIWISKKKGWKGFSLGTA